MSNEKNKFFEIFFPMRKECPKCTISIEKNGGYHIMRCTNCKILFCWICLDVGAKCHGCQCFKIANDSSEAKFLRYYERVIKNYICSNLYPIVLVICFFPPFFSGNIMRISYVRKRRQGFAIEFTIRLIL